jgi:hypothetical protein
VTDPGSEAGERIQGLATGPKGERGEPGRGLPRAVARSVAYLFFLAALFSVASYVILHHEIVVAVQGQVQQRCASVLAEAHIPLPHPITGNPSRIWEAKFEELQAQRARDLGCR